MSLDTKVRVLTPENIAFEYEIAGPFQRLVAYAIDLGIRALSLFIFFCLYSLLLSAFNRTLGSALGLAPLFVAWFVLEWFYGGVFETFWNGQTPGKWVMGLRVVTVQGQPITGLQAVLRNVLRAVDGLPSVMMAVPTFLLGLVVSACNGRFQRLGDLATGTMVIRETRQMVQEVQPVWAPGLEEVMEHLHPIPPLEAAMARVIAAYVQRREQFHPQRRWEIAHPLAQALLRRWHREWEVDPDLLLLALYQRHFFGTPGTQAAETASSAAAPSWPVSPAGV